MMYLLSLLFVASSSVHAFAFVPIQNGMNNLNSRSTVNSQSQIYSAAAAASETIADGLIKTVTQPGNGVPVQLGDIATVKYSCYIPDSPSTVPFSRSNNQKIVVGDGTMIPGWDKAIRTMKIGERAVVHISDPSLGYGDDGVPPLIPPSAELEIDLEILEAQPPMANIDFDNLAMADSTPVSYIIIIIIWYGCRTGLA